MTSTAIWWIRRDLRLSDNQALATALEHAETVIPLFILDPKLLASPRSSQRRVAFLLNGLRALSTDLHQHGSQLIIRQGEPAEQLRIVMNETAAQYIVAEGDISPYSKKRDGKTIQSLPIQFTGGITAKPMEALLKPDGTPYTIFTPFSRMWHRLPMPQKPILAPERLFPPPPIRSLEIPDIHWPDSGDVFPAGEAEAQRRLERFIQDTIWRYATDRDRMDVEATSGLSPYLRFGMLSARQAIWAAQEAAMFSEDAVTLASTEAWLNELIWREFYAVILDNYPHILRTAFRMDYRHIPWREDIAGFAAWAEGRTGFPIVDAGMRQLKATGWMHNRARMIVASFLTKDLLIDWRKGERYFMQHLIDGDPAANNGGWQWVAGTGTDAAPYFRVFNPMLQGNKYDPQGMYVRRWVPELADVPNSYIHSPWNMPLAEQNRIGCRISKDYPDPIINHAIARQRALRAYRA